MIHFIRLIRPLNLAVIALTMYAVRIYFLPFLNETKQISSESFDYFLLVFSTIVIAAGGNIINDYFDVKADRINKPDKLIITKYIKPRWAILTHWLFNTVAFIIACYLSWRYSTFWYVFIHLLSINLLWFYSMYFKRKFVIGNLIIALLTGLVPILCGIHFLNLTTPYSPAFLPSSWIINDQSWIIGLNLKIFFVLFFAVFAASLNLVREIVKDMEDIEGDLVLRAKTLPIVWGKERAKWLVIGIIAIQLIVALPFGLEAYSTYNIHFLYVMAPGFFIVLGNILVVLILLQSTEKQQLKKADGLLKILMVIGSCFPFYWYFCL